MRISLARLVHLINILITKFQLKNVLVFIENSNGANKNVKLYRTLIIKNTKIFYKSQDDIDCGISQYLCNRFNIINSILNTMKLR